MSLWKPNKPWKLNTLKWTKWRIWRHYPRGVSSSEVNFLGSAKFSFSSYDFVHVELSASSIWPYVCVWYEYMKECRAWDAVHHTRTMLSNCIWPWYWGMSEKHLRLIQPKESNWYSSCRRWRHRFITRSHMGVFLENNKTTANVNVHVMTSLMSSCQVSCANCNMLSAINRQFTKHKTFRSDSFFLGLDWNNHKLGFASLGNFFLRCFWDRRGLISRPKACYF